MIFLEKKTIDLNFYFLQIFSKILPDNKKTLQLQIEFSTLSLWIPEFLTTIPF